MTDDPLSSPQILLDENLVTSADKTVSMGSTDSSDGLGLPPHRVVRNLLGPGAGGAGGGGMEPRFRSPRPDSPSSGRPKPEMHCKGGGTPSPLQAAQPMPCHCLSDAKCQFQWHL